MSTWRELLFSLKQWFSTFSNSWHSDKMLKWSRHTIHYWIVDKAQHAADGGVGAHTPVIINKWLFLSPYLLSTFADYLQHSSVMWRSGWKLQHWSPDFIAAQTFMGKIMVSDDGWKSLQIKKHLPPSLDCKRWPLFFLNTQHGIKLWGGGNELYGSPVEEASPFRIGRYIRCSQSYI